MEKNRILWVIFSVSLFLVVVLAGGLYFLRPVPEDKTDAAAEAAPSIQGFDAFEYVRGRSELPGLEPKEKGPEEMVIVVGEKEEGPDAKQKKEEVRITALEEKRPEPRPEKLQPKKTEPSVPLIKREKPSPKQVKVTEYWIQTGSYKGHSRAELIVNLLTDKGLTGKITSREIGENTFYRVRIGPYTRKAEAEKFLAWVKEIQGFESSYISLVYAQRIIP